MYYLNILNTGTSCPEEGKTSFLWLQHFMVSPLTVIPRNSLPLWFNLWLWRPCHWLCLAPPSQKSSSPEHLCQDAAHKPASLSHSVKRQTLLIKWVLIRAWERTGREGVYGPLWLNGKQQESFAMGKCPPSVSHADSQEKPRNPSAWLQQKGGFGLSVIPSTSPRWPFPASVRPLVLSTCLGNFLWLQDDGEL